MQKKIIALAVAGLSTAAIAQTNVTIYGVADVSAQGYNMSSSKAQAGNGGEGTSYGRAGAGGAFGMTNNSSLLGFKGTEDLGNGLKALFQIETNVNITGGSAYNQANTTNSSFGSARDSYVGLNSKYGTVLGGYLTTPYRAIVTGFDVMPGATGVGRSENFIGTTRLNTTNIGGMTHTAANVNTGGYNIQQSVRSTALAYAMPTLYGFNGSLAYTGSNRNAWGNEGSVGSIPTTAVATVQPQSAISLNLGWEGYGIGIKGAYQQAKVNFQQGDTKPFQGVTSYVIGAQYTGIQGLKVAAMYNRNTIGLNQAGTGATQIGAQKGSNNQVWVGASYRFGNNEPRLSFASSGNTNGINGVGQDGGRQWTANWGYYLSKRTQVYGLVSGIGNNANGIYNMAGTGVNLNPTGGQNIVTYGAGLRTNF